MSLIEFAKNRCQLYFSIIFVFFSYLNFSDAGQQSTNPINLITKEVFLEENFILQSDSLNQIKFSAISNGTFHSLNLNGIPLYSLFDGQYNFNFIKNNVSFLPQSDLISSTNKKKTDSNAQNILIYSSNYNGLFKINYFLKKKSLYLEINPCFESSGGYYYSNRNNENILDLKFLENSSYQDIGLKLTGGFQNGVSNISLNILLNKSRLFVPVKLADSTHFKQQFDQYNSFLGYLNFENRISNNLRVYGNFFVRNFLRNYGSSFDSSYVIIGLYNSMLEIDEFNYGANLNFDYNIFNAENPTEFKIFYAQNIFLYSNASNQYRSRTESENLNFGISQKFNVSEKLSADFNLKLNSRAIIYSEMGNLPENKSQFEIFLNLNYLLRDSSLFTLKFNKFSVFPFVANYFKLFPNQIENLSLRTETWKDVQFSYSANVIGTLNFKISTLFTKGLNVNYPENQDTISYRYISDGLVTAFGGVLELNFNFLGINCESTTKVFLQDYNKKNLSIVQNYKLPKFMEDLTLRKDFDFGFSILLKSNYRSGISGYNFVKKEIISLNKFFVMDLFLQQKIFSEYIFLGMRNLTNQFYEYNFSIPQPGINFLFGLSLSL